ncbi:MAG TPA: stage II sporulation protein M [archaeon]|nr:stage II sporulation protein M [archaeon]
MLESIIGFKELTKRPYLMFIWTFVVASIAIILSTRVSVNVGGINLHGLFAVMFVILPSAYFLTRFIIREERLDEKEIAKHYKRSIWKRYEKETLVLLAYFFGLVLSFALWSFVVQPGFFQIQNLEIARIIGGTGNAAYDGFNFANIFLNNAYVFAFSFLFSFLFGAGAVFIIVWNASILGVRIAQLSPAVWDIPGQSLQFLPHGVFEIGGYILAAIAGGIISAAIIRKHHKRGVFKTILLDSAVIFIIGLILIVVGAGIEVL